MFKTVCLLKRKPGMTMAEFKDYYENHHAKLGERVLPDGVQYFRRYVSVVPNPVTGEVAEAEYDVITEMWFENQEVYDAAMTALSEPEIAAEIVEDEEKLFDRSKIRFCTIEECASPTAGAAAA